MVVHTSLSRQGRSFKREFKHYFTSHLLLLNNASFPFRIEINTGWGCCFSIAIASHRAEGRQHPQRHIYLFFAILLNVRGAQLLFYLLIKQWESTMYSLLLFVVVYREFKKTSELYMYT